MQHTVKRYYGDGFDACRYLDRFFDYRIGLPEANLERYYDEIGLGQSTWIYEAVCKAVIKTYSFGLREIEKFYRMAKVAAYKPLHSQNYSGFADGNAMLFSLGIVVPILIGLKMTNTVTFNQFIDGKDPTPLIAVMGDGETARGICSSLLDNTETYDETQKERKKLVTLEQKLTDAYYALFSEREADSWGNSIVGRCSFSRQTRKSTMRALSLLSEYASYE